MLMRKDLCLRGEIIVVASVVGKLLEESNEITYVVVRMHVDS